MKRSVAIVGPTPAFLEWSIAQECRLRDLDVEQPVDLPSQTFRQLRSVRELGVGRVEGRVFEGTCVHADVLVQLNDSIEDEVVEAARGFPAQEVFAISGTSNSIAECCDDCGANVVSQKRPGAWAGCYGWTPISMQSNQGLARSIETVLQELDQDEKAFFKSGFRQTQPLWFGLWIEPVITGQRASFIGKVMRKAMELPSDESEFDSMALISGSDPQDLLAALECCHRDQKNLHVRLVPYGHSDGLKWRLETHCPICKASLDSEFEQPYQCGVCGDQGILNRVAPRKVLGTRPYLNLSRLMGVEPTREFLERYRDSKLD